MKRALSELREDTLGREADAHVGASIKNAASKERKSTQKKEKDASRVKEIDELLAKWDEMGLRHAHGCIVNPPSPFPRIGSSPPLLFSFLFRFTVHPKGPLSTSLVDLLPSVCSIVFSPNLYSRLLQKPPTIPSLRRSL
jgi:hypothetical protein